LNYLELRYIPEMKTMIMKSKDYTILIISIHPVCNKPQRA